MQAVGLVRWPFSCIQCCLRFRLDSSAQAFVCSISSTSELGCACKSWKSHGGRMLWLAWPVTALNLTGTSWLFSSNQWRQDQNFGQTLQRWVVQKQSGGRLLSMIRGHFNGRTMFKEIFPGWCIQVKSSSVIYVDSLRMQRVQAHPGVILAAGKHAVRFNEIPLNFPKSRQEIQNQLGPL